MIADPWIELTCKLFTLVTFILEIGFLNKSTENQNYIYINNHHIDLNVTDTFGASVKDSGTS